MSFFKTGAVEKIIGIFKSGKKDEVTANKPIICSKCGRLIDLKTKVSSIKCLCGNEIILPKETKN